jgi:flavin reductase (DIM6/NTAB) family NADH-FMN oxidoreductase RutF
MPRDLLRTQLPVALPDVAALFELVDREVWIVTAAHAGMRGGLVATFVSPATTVAEMPRIVVGIAKGHHTWSLIESSNSFAVHLVEKSQVDLVWRFGLESGRDVDKFAGLHGLRTGKQGSPILGQALAWLDCRVENRMDTGDRTVYLAEILDGAGPGNRDSQSAEQNQSNLLTLRRLSEIAPTDKKKTMRAQFDADAQSDAEAIRRWRSAQANPGEAAPGKTGV